MLQKRQTNAYSMFMEKKLCNKFTLEAGWREMKKRVQAEPSVCV